MSSVFESARIVHAWGYISRADPRARIVAALLFSITTAVVQRFSALLIALAAAALAAALSGISLRVELKRLLPLNVVMLVIAIVLPFSLPGKSLAEFGPFCYTQEGFFLALTIAIKGNAIVLAILALLGTMAVNTLGHALSHLYVPDKLSHLFLFTLRYLDLLNQEYLRLWAAMRVRAFRPRMDRHSYHSFGCLLGMLFVRSYDRSERILAAMKCRGFQGRFYLLDHFAFHHRDLAFSLLALLVFLMMLVAEYL